MMLFTFGNRIVYKVQIFYVANKKYFVPGLAFLTPKKLLFLNQEISTTLAKSI